MGGAAGFGRALFLCRGRRGGVLQKQWLVWFAGQGAALGAQKGDFEAEQEFLSFVGFVLSVALHLVLHLADGFGEFR